MAEGVPITIVLAENVIVASQIAGLLEQAGYRAQQVWSHGEALAFLQGRDVAVVVADIDAAALESTTLLAWCKQQRPDIVTYAICLANNSGRCLRAFTLGVDGFFYLAPKQHQLGVERGIARQLLRPSPPDPAKMQPA